MVSVPSVALATYDVPDNPYGRPQSTGACAYTALCDLALNRWAAKRDYEQYAAELRESRTMGQSMPCMESLGRYLRFLREKVKPDGWTVIDYRGQVCFCPEADAQMHVGSVPIVSGEVDFAE